MKLSTFLSSAAAVLVASPMVNAELICRDAAGRRLGSEESPDVSGDIEIKEKECTLKCEWAANAVFAKGKGKRDRRMRQKKTEGIAGENFMRKLAAQSKANKGHRALEGDEVDDVEPEDVHCTFEFNHVTYLGTVEYDDHWVETRKSSTGNADFYGFVRAFEIDIDENCYFEAEIELEFEIGTEVDDKGVENEILTVDDQGLSVTC